MSVEQYYLNQAAGLPYFAGPVSQQGHGLGGIFGRLFRAVVPLFQRAAPVLKSAAATVAKEAVRSGADVVEDVLAGQSLSDSLAERGSEGVRRVAVKGVRRLREMTTSPKPINRKKQRPKDIFA